MGKLKNFNWSIINRKSDSKYKNINRIYLQVELEILRSDGALKRKKFMMTMKDFREFAMRLKEANEALE